MSLLYTDDVPTVAGWYFQRKNGVERVLEMPYCGVWPKHWTVLKQESLEAADEETCAQLEVLPESSWRVEWAGPIQSPAN